jgi:glycosyltransferase involved in cell wall biosynthesis
MMNDDAQPLVSVVVPVHNGERHLGEALESIRRQDYRPLEVLIVDDGSTDGSAAVCRSFPECRYIYQENAGVAAARNAGIAAAHGDFIAFLDQDDTWAPRKLSLQMATLLANPEAGFALGGAKGVLEEGLDWPHWVRKDSAINGELIFLPGTWLVRRNIFERIGGFDSRYTMACDTDWLVRAKQAGIERVLVPEVVLFWRIHGKNNSYQDRVGRDEGFKVVQAAIARRRQSRGGPP